MFPILAANILRRAPDSNTNWTLPAIHTFIMLTKMKSCLLVAICRNGDKKTVVLLTVYVSAGTDAIEAVEGSRKFTIYDIMPIVHRFK